MNPMGTCYRAALVGVRLALKGAAEKPAMIGDAIHALDAATSCTNGDPALAARAKVLHDALVALQPKLAARPRGQDDRVGGSADDPPPPPPEDMPDDGPPVAKPKH